MKIPENLDLVASTQPATQEQILTSVPEHRQKTAVKQFIEKPVI